MKLYKILNVKAFRRPTYAIFQDKWTKKCFVYGNLALPIFAKKKIRQFPRKGILVPSPPTPPPAFCLILWKIGQKWSSKMEFNSWRPHFWRYLKSETTLPRGFLTLNNFRFMLQNVLRPPSWPKLPKRVFWKFFEKFFFSPNVLKSYNSARKFKKIEKKKFYPYQLESAGHLKIFGLFKTVF